MSDSHSTTAPKREEARLILGLFLLALSVRLLFWSGTYTIGADSAAFLRMAELMRQGAWNEALKSYYHPGFPALISFAARITGDFVLAGYLLSIVISSLGAIPLYLLGRDFFGRPAAIVAAIFYCVQGHVVDLQSDIMTEGAYIALFIGGIWAGWKFISTQKLAWGVPAGICSAGCYLFRNEGLMLAAGLTCWFLIEAVRQRKIVVLGAVPIVVGIFLAISIPYLLWVRGEVGHWAVTAKGSGIYVDRLLSGHMLPSLADGVTRKTLDYFAKLHHYILLVPLGIGLFRGWKRQPVGRLFLLSFALVYLFGVFYNIHHMGYSSIRYLIPGFCLLLPFIGAGLIEATRSAAVPARLVTVAALVFLIGGHVCDVHGWDFLSARAAGEWIGKNEPRRATILSTIDKVGWYAHGDLIGFPNVPRTIDEAAAKADYVLFTPGDAESKSLPWLAAIPSDPRFRAVNEDFTGGRKGQREVRLYRVVR